MLKIIFTLIGLHIVEIWCYGMAFWTLSFVPGTGYLHGEHGTNTMFDAVYLSATTYSTVGYGAVSYTHLASWKVIAMLAWTGWAQAGCRSPPASRAQARS